MYQSMNNMFNFVRGQFRSAIACLLAADRNNPLCSFKLIAVLVVFLSTLLVVRQFTMLENDIYSLMPFVENSLESPIDTRPEDNFDWIADGRPKKHSYPLSETPPPEEIQSSTTNQNSSLLILLWTTMFGNRYWGLSRDVIDGGQPYRKSNCPVSNCYATTDRSRLSDASAVLIHFRDDFKYSDRPQFRHPSQYYVFVLWESPEHTYSWNPITTRTSKRYLDTDFKGFFNWTMTFRLDSDIPMYYGGFVREDKPFKISALAKKQRTAVAMVSNCGTASKRVEYIRELKRFTDVEIIGDCSDSWLYPTRTFASKICRQADDRGTPSECLAFLSSNFKFYLAFENSLCHDYVTEKFFRAASLNLIPVVLNGANMSVFAPPHSYINAGDFASPQELASYLERVGSDEVLYNSFFWWKRYYEPKYYWDSNMFEHSFCQLCSKLNKAKLEPSKNVKVYDDLEGWWMAGGKCLQGVVAPNQQFRNLLERTVITFAIPLAVILALKSLAKLLLFFSSWCTHRSCYYC